MKGEKDCQKKHIDDKILYRIFTNRFNVIIENAELIKEFDLNLFLKLIEKITVFEEEKIIVSLLA